MTKTEFTTEGKFVYSFFGVLHPERVALTIPPTFARFSDPRAGIRVQLRYEIAISQISAIVASDQAISDLATLRNHVETLIRYAVDGIGFFEGAGYDVELKGLIPFDGQSPIIFGTEVQCLRDRNKPCSPSELISIFSDKRGRYFARSLADMRESIRSRVDTAFFCYRAIESLRQYFDETHGKEKAWKEFRDALGVDESDLRKLKELADPFRHGSDAYITDEEKSSVYQITWAVVDKYIAFALKGYKTADSVKSTLI